MRPEWISAGLGGESEVIDRFHAFILPELDTSDIDLNIIDGNRNHFEKCPASDKGMRQ